MRLLKYLLISAVVLAELSCSAAVHIREVGLQGYVGSYGPQRVQIEISNPARQAQAILLRISLANFRATTFHADYNLQMSAGETRVLDVPVLLSGGGNIKAEQLDSRGHVLSSDERDADIDRSQLIAVICKVDSICQAVSESIRSGATVEEQNAKEQKLRIVLLQSPPQTWFAYSPVQTVVVAGPLDDSMVREAIESYARFGGDVIVASDQAPRDFLAEYRTPDSRNVPIGNGTVTFVSKYNGLEIRQIFAPEKDRQKAQRIEELVIRSTISSYSLLQWVGTQFVFPRLRWVIAWMVLYTLIIGALNFVVLRRIGKVEIGWITAPVIAVCFAVLFYSISVRGKMKRFTLDQATVCWMDDKSSVGVADHQFRVASPQVRDVVLQVPSMSVISSGGRDPLFRASDAATIWNDDGRQRRAHVDAPDIVVDSAQHLPLEMLRLSFRDLQFRSVHKFPGTVAIEKGVLKNSTGQDFSQGLLVDFAKHEFYDLGALANGGETRPFSLTARKLDGGFPRGMRVEHPHHMQNTFSLAEFINSDHFASRFSEQPLTFVGLTNTSLLEGDLEGIAPDRKVYMLYVVTMGRRE